MPKRLSPKSTLDALRTEAKRRLKALRATDPAATLRGAQHAVARDYGFDGWAALREALEASALSRLTPAERVDIVLRSAWQGDRAALARVLARHPEIATANLLTATVFGDFAEVRRRLTEDPAAANRKAGPLNWEPLLYLAFSRLPVPAAAQNAVAIAEMLLDAGADPNAAFDDGWGNPFKPLTGVIGHGEGVRPPHPEAERLVDVLIARGADPFDTQSLYDTSIVDDDVTWTARLYEACAARGEEHRWREPAQGLTGRHSLPAVDYLLGNAVGLGHARRAEWLVAHGADPNGIHAYSGRRHHTHALLSGRPEMAALLVRLGATPERLEGAEAFVAAALSLDRAALVALAKADPRRLEEPEALRVAAERGRLDVVDLLLGLGMSPDVAEPGSRTALHIAAMQRNLPLAQRLVAAGAAIDPREKAYDATPLSAAVHFGHPELVAFLAPLSRDVFALAAAGETQRLDALLAAEPALIEGRRRDGRTLLFHLPDDEDAAVAIARLLLRHGADPAATNGEGLTPARAARLRGLDEAADAMDGFS